MRRIAGRGLAIAVLAVAAGAGPAQAASVSMLAEIRSASSPWVYFTAAPGEQNDVSITIEDGNLAYPKVIRVVDRGATLTTGGGGDCEALEGCSAPCRIESPHVARCVIADAYPNRYDPAANYPSFREANVSLGDGADRFTTLPGIGRWARVDATDGGDLIKLGAGGKAGAAGGTIVEFGNPTATGEAAAGPGGTIRARDGAKQTISCYSSDYGRIEKDPFDVVQYYCSGLGPLGNVP